MIDTGEAENVIAKYLLDKGIKTVDYLIISHFDSDHCKSSKEVIEKLNVKQLVISKQAKESKEFENLINTLVLKYYGQKLIYYKKIHLIIIQLLQD